MTPYVYWGTVERVIDGDTIDITLDLGFGLLRPNTRIRLLHINCPEMKTANGPKAKQFTESLCQVGTKILVKSDELDAFGRVLAEVELPDGRLLHQVILDAHHAVPFKK